METVKQMCRRALIILTTGLVLSGAGRAGAALPESALYDLARQAEDAFARGNELAASDAAAAAEQYQEAILRFRRIIEQGGVVNEHLYYNIGNAYLMRGDLGRAILNYRRAERVGGQDADLAKNLAYARQQRRDQIPPRAQRQVLRTLFFWHYDFSMPVRFVLAATCWVLSCLVGTAAVLLGSRRWLGRVAVILLAPALLWGGSVALEQGLRRPAGVVVAEQVVARQGDGANYPESFTDPLHAGTEFAVRERRGGWWRIELANGVETWIPATAAELI